MGGGDTPFHAFKLSGRVTLIVEADEYGQTPFMYAVHGKDRMVLIDTGSATGDLAGFVRDKVNFKNLPILVINSHSHYDHVGCNYQFADPSGAPLEGSLGVRLSGLRKEFTSNYSEWCLAKELNFPLKTFGITQWLSDGEQIILSDDDPSDSLEVLLLPGHCPDSLALYDPKERMLFVGDIIYRNLPVCVFCYGADFDEFVDSIGKLITFVGRHGGFDPARPILLAAGHVDEKLPPHYLFELANLLRAVKRKEIDPVQVTAHVAMYGMGQTMSITLNTSPGAPLTVEDIMAGTGVPPLCKLVTSV